MTIKLLEMQLSYWRIFHTPIRMLYRWQKQIISSIYCSVSPQLFNLVRVMEPVVQQSIIQTFYALCQTPSASDIRIKLKEGVVTKGRRQVWKQIMYQTWNIGCNGVTNLHRAIACQVRGMDCVLEIVVF